MIRRFLALTLLAIAVSACQVTVQISTTLNDSGGGTLKIATILDKDLRRRLDGPDAAAAGLDSINALFERLHAKGWTTERTEPGGGLSMSASRSFADSAGFDRTLAELRSSSSEASQGGIGLSLDYQTTKSFFSVKSRFSGSIDTKGKGLDRQVRLVLEQLRPYVHFEIRTRLPGGAGDVQGGGTVEDGEIVWRPDLGTALSFSASGSSLRAASTLVVIVPVVLLVGGVAWFLLGRSKEEVALSAIVPDETTAEP